MPVPDQSSAVAAEAISFSVSTRLGGSESHSDWRQELKEKLQEHQLKKTRELEEKQQSDPAERARRKHARVLQKVRAERKEQAGESPGAKDELESESISPSQKTPAPPRRVKIVEKPADVQPAEVARQLFTYKLGDVSPTDDRARKIVTFRKNKKQPIDRPVIRKNSPKKRVTLDAAEPHPRQRSLRLEADTPPEAVPAPVTESIEETTSEALLSAPELMLSRMLAGLIDLLMAATSGALFAFLASRVADTAFPSFQGLTLAVACGVLIFFLNSIFFLGSLAQTPGMMWTHIELKEGDRAPDLKAILIRTFLFLPSVISVIGLVWALFDRRSRCLHDLLSHTRVVPRPPLSSQQS